MISGSKKERIDQEDVLYYTNDGKEIYEKYIGRLSKGAMKCPWRDDKHPSWGVYQSKDGTWLWKDIASEESGNPFTFVQQLFNLSYKAAFQKILYDFDLSNKGVVADRVYTHQKTKEKEYSLISIKPQPFQKRHHEFWNCAEVTEADTKKKNCYAVKELAINRIRVHISPRERVFAYYAKDIDRMKVYFPDRYNTDRFRTNVPYNYLWEYSKQICCDKLVGHKSMKDLIVFSLLFPNNIATNNESIKLFNEEVVGNINTITSDFWLFYGSDEDGVRKCTEITKSNNWRYINTPHDLLPEVNDVYSYVKKYSLKDLEQFCKTKQLL